MRNSKNYSTQTFTKRVDHEGGLHRPGGALPEPAICGTCKAVYTHRRWTAKKYADDLSKYDASELVPTICPACAQIANNIVGGYVHLEGMFLEKHREEITDLLKNEAERSLEDNPLGKIMSWQENANGSIEIHTTNEHLAQRLGHAVEKAYDGDVSYDFSHENKVARVRWHRD
jgi:hypothetical protein